MSPTFTGSVCSGGSGFKLRVEPGDVEFDFAKSISSVSDLVVVDVSKPVKEVEDVLITSKDVRDGTADGPVEVPVGDFARRMDESGDG